MKDLSVMLPFDIPMVSNEVEFMTNKDPRFSHTFTLDSVDLDFDTLAWRLQFESDAPSTPVTQIQGEFVAREPEDTSDEEEANDESGSLFELDFSSDQTFSDFLLSSIHERQSAVTSDITDTQKTAERSSLRAKIDFAAFAVTSILAFKFDQGGNLDSDDRMARLEAAGAIFAGIGAFGLFFASILAAAEARSDRRKVEKELKPEMSRLKQISDEIKVNGVTFVV